VANGGAHFEVTNPRAPRYAVQADIAAKAEAIAAAASGGSPVRTGQLAGGFSTRPGYSDPGTTVVTIQVPYFRFVEYGTRHMAARAMLGRAMAAGG
jgi:N-formylglutamate amidohydrolase